MTDPSEAQLQLDNAATALNQSADELATATTQADGRTPTIRAIFHIGRTVNHILAAVQLLVRERDRRAEE